MQGCGVGVGVGVGVAQSRGNEPGVGVGVGKIVSNPTSERLSESVARDAARNF